jgi:AAA+ ATPase superfamily predicted ATPase
MNSPFQFGKLAGGNTFINRTKERISLKNNLLSGINTMLISPRRYGKSSLVAETMNEVLQENTAVKVCFIDAFTIRNEEEFYLTFASEIVKSTENTWKKWISVANKYLKAISPKISIGADPMTDFSIGIEFQNIKENELELLNLPERIAQDRKTKIIVCIDEFQNLAKLKDFEGLEKKMRSVWQKQQNVTYCLYGSKRHWMMDIFNSSERPFYRFGQIMFLQKIDEKEWVDYIVNAFERTKKMISPKLALKLVRSVKSHSWYVQQLAHFVWNLTEGTATEMKLKTAIEQIIETNLPLYQSECERLSASQLNLLVAIINGEQVLTSAEIMSKYKLGTPRNVSKNKSMLQQLDIIEKTLDNFEFLDPVFERWFRRQYAKIL